MNKQQMEEALRLHNAYLRGEPDGVRADLRGADLRAADLRRANLRAADLCGADLRRANLSEANLRAADLRAADLRAANLSEANLSEANLRAADLRRADLRGANLFGANLFGANLFGADLSGANLRAADLRGDSLILGPVCHGHLVVCERETPDSVARVRAGCKTFSFADARAYWSGKPDRSDAIPALDYLATLAQARGWKTNDGEDDE